MTTFAHVRYPLCNGFIHHWLVAGPQAIPVAGLEQFTGDNIHLDIARRYYEAASGVAGQPVEPARADEGQFTLEETAYPYTGQWRYARCLEDHLVDFSVFHHTPHYLRAWAYAEIEAEADTEVTLVLTTNGPADLWLNEERSQRQEHFARRRPESASCNATLKAGNNRLLVRFENVATRDCVYVMALQIRAADAASALTVCIPTAIEPADRRTVLETIFDTAYLTQYVFAQHDEISIHWPVAQPPAKPLNGAGNSVARLQALNGKIYAETNPMGVAGATLELGHAYQHPNAAYNLILMPRAKEYYEDAMRITRTLPAWGMGIQKHHETPYSAYPERRSAALLDAARRELNVFSEIAKMAIGWWSKLEMKTLTDAIAGINQRRDCSDFTLIGLLGMVYRFGEDPQFPGELRQPLEECILNFKYWYDEPGADAMWYYSENHQILFHACEILAGQLYPDRVFSNSGQTGQWHREKGERLALAWLHERGTRGFSEWDSNCYFEEDLLALSHLADLAETDAVWEMAAVLIDKILFTIAVNSYKGVFGSTHGRTYAEHILGGRMESTSPIAHLMWGMGSFNAHILGVVAMACAENYELPVMLQVIAADVPDEMWARERHAPGEAGEGVNKVTYKTPDGMLCSAQDYRAGAKGSQEHIWQATLGPDATVFVTHPPCASLEGSHRPNFWAGNAILPRVAQWKDVLIAVHTLPDDDWMGFTHAYFPVYAFDDYAVRDHWAFARKGTGYLALAASQPLSFITTGRSAYRELRAAGSCIWVCHMGRAALDSAFGDFQEKLLALELTFDGSNVRCATLRGDTLSFGWEGDFLRNDVPTPLKDFPHYETPYCAAPFPAERMDIQYKDVAMRLEFEK